MLRMWFEALGFAVFTAAGGVEALALLGTRAYDVVVCDLLMPDMNGDELFRSCQGRWPGVARHFVFFTGCSQGIPAADFVAASGQPYLRKPCRLAEMQTAVEQVSRPIAA